MKKIAHCIHHTHWDLIWYFSAQDAAVQFSYNMKEILRGFEEGRIDNFFMDGQTAPIDEYLMLHPKDEEKMKSLISEGKLIVGPFNSQLDCFITNGESVINNLRLGMKTAKRLGKVSKLAYLPDSFGHSYDFPKIFNQFGIHDFVITRGVGDDYDLDSEFYMESNDGSKLLVCVMIAGYGYGCYAFKDGNLFKEEAVDYNKISVKSLFERLLNYSTIKDEFVFPLGFDQNPAILDIPEKVKAYNLESDEYELRETTWNDFCKRVREKGENLKTHQSELLSTQYHRIHRSMFSARADIKALQDRCERALTYELQPMMSMLDSLGIDYDHGLIDKAWETLMKCQTHSSATLTDETNDYIEQETRNALNLVTSMQTYLMKVVSISLDEQDLEGSPLIIFNTLPTKNKKIVEAKIFSKTQGFKILDGEKEVNFSIVNSRKRNHGVLRKDIELIDQTKFYYEIDIVLETDCFNGISYKTYQIVEDEKTSANIISSYDRFIENNRYKIYQDEEGITIYDKALDKKFTKAIYLEESGDEGDSFDYSYPDHDLILTDYLADAETKYMVANEMSVLEIKGKMLVPSTLTKRKHQECDSDLPYSLRISLKKDSEIIEISGSIENQATQHRVRFIVSGDVTNDYSYAGTQFGYIKRETNPASLQNWRKDNWFEEPSTTYPLLNHVSMVNENYTATVFTRSSKEYELMQDNYQDLAITIFRSYGAMGYPDLNRRPGRPSGLDYMVFETPECQMIKTNTFEIALGYRKTFEANELTNTYIEYACENAYYQKQEFDKSINPIAYFPTNPLEEKLPLAYEFVTMENAEGSFGTLVKADDNDGYVMRIYNNENESVTAGTINVKNDYKVYLSNLEDTVQDEVSNNLSDLAKGELRILKLKK